MGIVKTSNIGPNDDTPDLNLTSGPGGYVYVNGSIITGSGSVIVGPTGATGPQGEQGNPGLDGLIGATGPQGEQGNPGVDGAVAPAGLTWSGVWSGTQSYQINSVISYNSASWWSKSTVPSAPPILPNDPPDVDTTHWALLATQGPVGPQGIQGPQGERGYSDFSRTYGSISATQSPNYTLASYDINDVIYYGRIKLPETTINDIGKEVVLIISSGNTTNLYTDVYTYDNSIGIRTSPGTTIGMLRTYYGEEYRFTCNGVNDWLCENISSYTAQNIDFTPTGDLSATNVQTAIEQLNNLHFDEHVLEVKKGVTGPGQFSTIKSAVDSITLNDIDNRYTIMVGTGDFYEDTITLKPWVNVVGHDRSTRVLPNSPNQHIFIGSDYSSVISCLVTGATATSAFYHESPTGTPQSAFVIKDVIFGENDTHVECYADTAQTTVHVVDCRYGDGFTFDKGFIAYNNLGSSIPARILLLHCYSQGMSDISKPTFFAKASGENCEIVMNSVQANANTIQLGTSFLIIENGARCRLNAVNLTGWDNGIWNPNLGLVGELGSKFIGVAVSCQNTNNHILIENEDSYGQLSGTFEKGKVLSQSPNISLVYSDPEVGDYTISGGLNITYSPTVTTDVSTLIARSSTMGVIEGGYLSEVIGLTISIQEGYGYYHLDPIGLDPGVLYRLDWSYTELLVTPNSTNYIYFDSTGNLNQDPTIPDTSKNILIGRVRSNTIGFEFIERTPLYAEHWANKATKLFRKGIGPVYSSGSIVSKSSTPFKLNISQGLYYYGANEFSPVGGLDITFDSYRPDGLGDWIISSTNSVDNTYYSGTNSLIALSSGYYTKHSLYIVGDNGEEKYFMVYDNNEYVDLLTAQLATLPTPPSYFTDAVALIAGIVIQQGTSSIIEVRDQRPVIGFRSPSLNASSIHSDLLNLTNDDHPQYILSNGTRALTGNLIMGSNSITGVNLINSIDISSHSSRHLPGGLDPLLTGTPSTIGTVNQIGSINAFSRQDHIHAHGSQLGGSLHALVTATVSGFMSASDKVILDNITSLTQSLTNKTISGSSNYVDSDGLKTTTNPVYTIATAPSVNQVLMAISATQATWQTISTGTPSTIGTTNQVGSSSNFAKQDHIHAHGDQLGGSLHALVTATVSGFMSAPDKVILDNITSSTQSLTNKGITGSTNYVDANGLKTTTNPVYVVSTAPSIGQSLIAVSATAATWQTPQSASTQKTPVDPTTTSSTIGVMMGLSASITPVLTGKIMIIISGDMDNDTNSRGTRVQIRTGTGTPPVNGAALTGTAQGGLVSYEQGSNNVRMPFSLNCIENGLTLNTAVWVDISVTSITGGVSRVRDISISVVEL